MFKKLFSDIGGTVAKNVNNNVILRLRSFFCSLLLLCDFFHFDYVFLSFLRCHKILCEPNAMADDFH